MYPYAMRVVANNHTDRNIHRHISDNRSDLLLRKERQGGNGPQVGADDNTQSRRVDTQHGDFGRGNGASGFDFLLCAGELCVRAECGRGHAGHVYFQPVFP